jgi:hypothetical protein
MSDQNWRAELDRLALLRQRQSNGMPSVAELLKRMADAGELEFLEKTQPPATPATPAKR